MLNHVFLLNGKQYFWDHVLYTILHCSSGISPFDAVGSNEDHDKEKLDKLLHHLMEVDLITDGTVARDNTQLKVGIALVSGRDVLNFSCAPDMDHRTAQI